MKEKILVIGGYGVVGRRVVGILREALGDRVVAAGRHPTASGVFVDVADEASIERALEQEGVSTVVACVRQVNAGLLRAAVRRGIAYTSIAPPWMPWPETRRLDEKAKRSGARAVLATGIEPGISSVLAGIAAKRLGAVDEVETALLLGVGDDYGSDSMAFILEEIAQAYTIRIDGRDTPMRAFALPTRVDFPNAIGRRRAYTMAFRDQLYYPHTLGATTAIARITLDPPWLGPTIALVASLGGRRWIGGGRASSVHGLLMDRLRLRYRAHDQFALVVSVRQGERVMQSTLIGRGQAKATAVATAAVAMALEQREVPPGAWLAEQIIDARVFLERLAKHGLVPEVGTPA